MGHEKGKGSSISRCEDFYSFFVKVLDKSVSDELLGEIIADKLRHSDVVVSFAEIARVAKKENRKHLAAIVSLSCFPLVPSMSVCCLGWLELTCYCPCDSYWITKFMPRTRCLC